MIARSLICAMAVASMALNTANAAPILLASHSSDVAGGGAPESEPQVEFILQLPGSLEDKYGLGVGAFWEAPGQLDFTNAGDPGFAIFALSATNGIAEEFRFWDLFPSGGGHISPPAPESLLFGVSPDLFGYELTQVRLIVENLVFQPWTPDPLNNPDLQGFTYSAEITYEFYGLPVPEPSSLAVLAVPAVIAVIVDNCRCSRRQCST